MSQLSFCFSLFHLKTKVELVICGYLAKLLRMRMPGKSADENIENILNTSDQETDHYQSHPSNEEQDLDEDIDGDDEAETKKISIKPLHYLPHQECSTTNTSYNEFGVMNVSPFNKTSSGVKAKLKNGQIYFRSECEQAYLKRDNTFPQATYTDYLDVNSSGSESSSSSSMRTRNEYALVKRSLLLILKEMRTLTQKMKDDEDYEAVSLTWKFAAMVIDRLCMFFFAFATFFSTAAILFTSPNLYKSSDPDPKF